MSYSLKINYKKIESNPKKSTPESRKKRELVGNFKNQGTTWCINPKEVNAYDFKSLASGVFIPFGIYDNEMKKVNIRYHDTLPQWNYTIFLSKIGFNF